MLTDRAPNLGAERPIALPGKRGKLLGSRTFATERYESFRFVHEQQTLYVVEDVQDSDDRPIAYPAARVVLARL